MAIQGSSHKNKGEEEVRDHALEVAKGGVVAFVGKVTGMVLSLVFMVLISRMAGAKILGYFSMILTFYMIMVRLLPLGLHASILKYAGEAYGKGDLAFVKGFLLMGIRVILRVSIPTGVVFFLASHHVARFFSKPHFVSYVKLFGFFLPVLALFYFLTESFKALRRTDLLVLIQSIGLFSLSCLFFSFLWKVNFGISSPALSFFLSATLMLILAILVYRRFFSGVKATRINFSPFAKVSLLLMASGLFYLFLTQVDTLMVGYFRPAEEVGIYSAASKAALFVGFGLNIINYIFPPIISYLFSQGKMAEIEALGRRSARWAFTYALVLALVYAVYPLKILGVFGRGFSAGREPLLILTSAQILSVAIGSVGYVLSMTEHQGFFFRATLLSVILNFAGDVLLIPLWGIKGAAVATGFSLVFSKILELLYVRKRLNMWVFSYSVLKGTMLFLGLLILSLFLKSLNPWLPVIFFPIGSVALVSSLMDREDKRIFLSFLSSF